MGGYFWLINVGLIIFAAANVAVPLYLERRRLGFVLAVWKSFRPKMFLEVVGILFLVICAAVAFAIYLPALNWGWFSLISPGGGNVLIAPVLAGATSKSLLIRDLVILFFGAFLIVAPFLAKSEENLFRRGHHDWASIARQSVKFGLVHLVVGVPLTVTIALIGVGFFFGHKYRAMYRKALTRFPAAYAEELAVFESTCYHSLYNSIILLFLLWLAL